MHFQLSFLDIGRNSIAFAADEQGYLISPDAKEMNTVKIQFGELVLCKMNVEQILVHCTQGT